MADAVCQTQNREDDITSSKLEENLGHGDGHSKNRDVEDLKHSGGEEKPNPKKAYLRHGYGETEPGTKRKRM